MNRVFTAVTQPLVTGGHRGGHRGSPGGHRRRSSVDVPMCSYTHHPALKNQDFGARRSSLAKSQALGQFFNPWWDFSTLTNLSTYLLAYLRYLKYLLTVTSLHSVAVSLCLLSQHFAPQPCSRTHHLALRVTNAEGRVLQAAQRWLCARYCTVQYLYCTIAECPQYY